MNTHYNAVIRHLEQLRSDAENGILAIRRLMSRESGEAPAASAAPVRQRTKARAQGPSATSSRIIAFLEAHPDVSFSTAEIASNLGLATSAGLRSTLTRLAGTERIRKPGAGRYQAKAAPAGSATVA